MRVVVNGSPAELDDSAVVTDAVVSSGHSGGFFGVAVAVNGEVVPRSEWASTRLHGDDRIEVLVAAQGG